MEVKIEKIRQESKMSSLSTTATTGIKSCWTNGDLGEVREDRAVQRAWFAVSFISDRKDYEKAAKSKEIDEKN